MALSAYLHMNFQFSRLQGANLTIFNLLTGFVNVAISFAVGFFLSPFIVSRLGAEANGFTQLANNFVMYVTLLTTAFNSMAGRFVSVAFHAGDTEKAKCYYSSVFITNLVMMALLVPTAVFVVWNLQGVVVIENASPVDVKILFSGVFFNFFLGLVSSLYSMCFYVRNAVFYANLFGVLRTVCNAVLLLALFSMLPVRLFYTSMASAFLGIVFLPIHIRLQRDLLPDFRLDVKRFQLRAIWELFCSGIWNTVNQCGHLLMTGMDLLLANWFISPTMMGVIAISKTIPSAVIQLGSTVNNNLSPSVTIRFARNDVQALMQELRWGMKVSTMAVGIPLVTFCAFSVPFYRLWMPTENAHTLSFLSVLGCFQFIIFSGTQNLYNIFTASNRLKVNSLSFCLTGILNVLLVYLLLRQGVSEGAYILVGLSTLLSVLRIMTVVLPYQASLLQLPWYTFYKDVWYAMLCAFMNLLIAWVVMSVIPADGWLTMIVSASCTAVLTLVAQSLLLFSRSEKEKLMKLIKPLHKFSHHG